MVYTGDTEFNKEQKDVLTREIRKFDKTVLDEINAAVNWYSLLKPIQDNLKKASIGHIEVEPLQLVKSLVLQAIYDLGEIPFEVEVTDRKSFQKFLDLNYGDKVASNELLKSCKKELTEDDSYDKMFDNFFKQLLDAEVIPEQDLLSNAGSTKAEEEQDILISGDKVSMDEIENVSDVAEEKEEEIIKIADIEEKEVIETASTENDPLSVDEMIKEIEDRVKRLHDKKSPEEKEKLKEAGLKFGNGDEETKEHKDENLELYSKLNTIDDSLKKIYHNIEVLTGKSMTSDSASEKVSKEEIKEQVSDLYAKLKGVDETVQETKEISEANGDQVVSEETESITEKLDDLESKIQEKLKDVPTESGAKKENGEKEDLYKRLFDSFYTQLVDADIINEASKTEEKQKVEDKIESAAEETVNVTVEEPKIAEETDIKEEVKVTEKKANPDFVLEGRVEEKTGETIPVVMRPKQKEINLRDKKKYPIFNDANLTEDYELGLRFYKLGFKTSFVNLKTDARYGNSRIGTGEYFPNSFWASVKQKSRWIAGIVFQNWKIHGWKGTFKTKYFLARDRKTIVSFIGTALSFIVFAYFLAFGITRAFGVDYLPSIVQQNSVLWYLMLMSLLFMFGRIFHRFAFTYNWYGLRYAVMSIIRIFFDNVVNFFAIIRAIKVFRQTKDKVVWDSTEHY